eukprot:6344392-Amphidinium_carterae.1
MHNQLGTIGYLQYECSNGDYTLEQYPLCHKNLVEMLILLTIKTYSTHLRMLMWVPFGCVQSKMLQWYL